MTLGEVSAEGPHSTIGKINRCINSSKIWMQMPFSPILWILQKKKKILRGKGHHGTLEDRISG